MGCQDIIAAVGQETLNRECMTCCHGCSSTQATTRSVHAGGVFVCLADGRVQFISDFIEKGTLWDLGLAPAPEDFLVWQRLCASQDGLPIDASAF